MKNKCTCLIDICRKSASAPLNSKAHCFRSTSYLSIQHCLHFIPVYTASAPDQSSQRNPPTFSNSLTKFITQRCIEYTSPLEKIYHKSEWWQTLIYIGRCKSNFEMIVTRTDIHYIYEHTDSAPLHTWAYCFSPITYQSIHLQFHYMSEHTA
jgi:hypothetical protein